MNKKYTILTLVVLLLSVSSLKSQSLSNLIFESKITDATSSISITFDYAGISAGDKFEWQLIKALGDGSPDWGSGRNVWYSGNITPSSTGSGTQTIVNSTYNTPVAGEVFTWAGKITLASDGSDTGYNNTGNLVTIDNTATGTTWIGSKDSDWTAGENWTANAPVATSDVVIPSSTYTNNFPNATTPITVASITLNSGASFKSSSTVTGSVTYKVAVNDTNWHLMSSPVESEGYDTTWVDNNLIDNTTDSGTNVGIATYSNTSDADGDWIYTTDGSTGTFNTGQGYSIKRDATGSDISFTGTVKVNDAALTITANDIDGANENRWSLIGNPFPSYISVVDLLALTANDTALEDSREALYVWNGTTYTPVTTGYIHPGQGFFVNSNVASTTIAINQDMLSHQTGVTFHKSASSNTSINLLMTDGTQTKSTEINYIADKTTGLDPKFDLGTFTGASTSFSIFSHLVSNSKGVDFMRQSLPLDYENQIIPIGVNAIAGKEITFSVEALNLPTGIKAFLEDKVNNTFTRLDEANSNLKVTLNEDLNGIGRFYLHTKSSVLSTNNIKLENISIYKTNASNLRITGLQQGKVNIKLFSILGKQVMNTSFKSKDVSDVSLSKLASGVYIVQLETEAGKINKKIILE